MISLRNYETPRNLLNILSNTVVELPRNRENSFCCGAGGAQFWKEEEEGDERISDNRYREAQAALGQAENNVLAVGCPFCKSMLDSTPAKEHGALAVRDIAELLLESVQRRSGIVPSPHASASAVSSATARPSEVAPAKLLEQSAPFLVEPERVVETVASQPETRKKWVPRPVAASIADTKPLDEPGTVPVADTAPAPERKKWAPKRAAASAPVAGPHDEAAEPAGAAIAPAPERKKWRPKS